MSIATNTAQGSGTFLNISAMVQNALLAKTNQLSSYSSKEIKLETSLSSLGKLKSYLSQLQDAMSAISLKSNEAATASTDFFKLSSQTEQQYNVSITTMASAQNIILKQGFDSKAIGISGSIELNGMSKNTNTRQSAQLAILATDTIFDIKQKINDSGLANCSVIKGSDGYHLNISATATGSNGGITLNGMDAFNFNGNSDTVANYNIINPAQDTVATVNGLQVTSSNNKIDLGEGTSLTALKPTNSVNVVNTVKDISTLNTLVQNFVDVYNGLMQSSGMKSNSSITRQIEAIRSTITTSAGIVSFDKSGKMQNDLTPNTTFNTSNILANLGTNSKLYSNIDQLVQSGGVLQNGMDALNSAISRNTRTISDLNQQISTQTQLYTAQYSKMDAYISQLNGNLQTIQRMYPTTSGN